MRRVLHYVVPFWLALSCAIASDKVQNIAKVRISFTSPAYAGMPIWLMVNSDKPHKIHYPASTTPTDFGCNEVEVQHNGTKLTPVKLPLSRGHAGSMCGWVSAPESPESRLPLHLQYPSMEPGVYLVRYTRSEYVNSQSKIAEQSEWTPLEVHRSASVDVQEGLRVEAWYGSRWFQVFTPHNSMQPDDEFRRLIIKICCEKLNSGEDVRTFLRFLRL